MKESPFGVTYIYGTSYLEPVVIAKSIIEKNTYKYQHYPETPPGSPSLDPIKNEIEVVDDKDGSVKTATSSASSAAAVNYSMESILDTAKYIFTKRDSNNDELYDSDFLTNDQIYSILSLTFPRLQYVYSPRQFSLLLNKHKDHFGVLTQKKVNGSKVPIRGRLLFILKKSVQENLNVNKKCFKRHIQNSDGEWINVGYVRKSPTNESNETRERLIQKMVSKLINIGFCEKIYVSPCTSVQDPVFKRDFKDDEKRYGDGNTQDFLRYLSLCTKNIRVCVISYAGLTTDTEDLQNFLSIHRKVKEVVVIHDSNIEILDRKALKRKDILEKFNCRKGTIPRAKEFKQ